MKPFVFLSIHRPTEYNTAQHNSMSKKFAADPNCRLLCDPDVYAPPVKYVSFQRATFKVEL